MALSHWYITALSIVSLLWPYASAFAEEVACTTTIQGRVYEGIDEIRFVTQKVTVAENADLGTVLGSGDFNGDGFWDLLIRSSSGSPAIALNEKGSRFRIFSLALSGLEFNWDSVAIGDFNGDGLADLLGPLADKQQWGVATAGENVTFHVKEFPVPDHVFPNPYILPLDFNCDGMLDFIVQSSTDPKNFSWIAQVRGGTFKYVAATSYDRRVRGALQLEHGCHAVVTQGIIQSSRGNWDMLALGKQTISWASFPPFDQSWDVGWILDLNGDQWEDVLVSSENPAFPWWAAISNGRTGIERAAAAPFGASPVKMVAAVGDFNGDGTQDLIGSSTGSGTMMIASSIPGRALANVRISLSNGTELTSNKEGLFEAQGLDAGKYTVTAQKDGLEFQHNSRELTIHRCQTLATQFGIVPRREENLAGALEGFGAPPPGPYLCLGYAPGTQDPKWARPELCPPQFAAYGTSDPDTPLVSLEKLRIVLQCCKLPFSDVLIGSPIRAAVECPENHIAVGAPAAYDLSAGTDHPLLCAPINTERFQLGEVEAGVYWGLGSKLTATYDRIPFAAIPVALREGLSRWSYATARDVDGCIGSPPGSLLVAKGQSRCRGLRFRQLQFRGIVGDPPQGTPVQMFPRCEFIQNRYDPTTSCTIESSNESPSQTGSNSPAEELH